MCFSDLSACDLIALSSSLAIYFSKNLSKEEITSLAIFFTAFGDNLAIISTQNN